MALFGLTEKPGNTPDAGRVADDVTSYLNMRLDALKMDVVENLSITFSNAFGVVIFLVLGGMGLIFFTGVLTYLLGLLIGSLMWACVIMGGLFLLAAVVLFVNRQRIFADMMVRMFSKMFFKPEQEDEE